MPSHGVCKNLINARHLKDGYGTIENPARLFKQDFRQMKRYCQRMKLRFVDEVFPPDSETIGEGLLSPEDLARVVWLRPHKIVPNPALVVDTVSRFDFGQGMLGNCWFLASAATLSFQDFILKQVIPLDQTFDNDYCGIWHFRFWRFGIWVDVIIDDKLPTINGQLIFVHSTDPAEFWPALLEKAYAKVCGSYSDMNAGTPAEALVDFTGGVHFCIDLQHPPPELWEMMSRAGRSRSLMGCGTPQGETSANTVLPNGLVQGHAYCITGLKEVMSQGQIVRLVRLLNPWGKGEWKGAWSDQCPRWQTVSPEERAMCQSVRDDGEFWMSLEEFVQFYSDLDICCMCPDFLDGSESCHWKTSYYEGRWIAGSTAGGCMNNTDTFWCNPQYRVKVEQLVGGCAEKQGEKNMLVSLMQKPDKRKRRMVKNLYIGFSVFEVPEHCSRKKGKFQADFFSSTSPVAQTKTYVNGREVMEFLLLKPGEYLIVPSTFKPNETASFILTILTKSETHVHENAGGMNHEHMDIDQPLADEPVEDEHSRRDFFRQFSNNYEEVDAEKLQTLLNNKVLEGQLKHGGFSIDACRSLIALTDMSLTGTLTGEEFILLWKKISGYKEMFVRSTASEADTLSVDELRSVIAAFGMRINDVVLNVVVMRYRNSCGRFTLESFVNLIFRLERMYETYNQMADGMGILLRRSEWLQLTMYA
ncbi:calpain-1 catalytic subunit-like [Salarias fasciatus]|uniref:Calpain-1 catalytic subunit-like n=1 Tax=Salarias fasciatus TaxID=181472 RepID=A0A672J6G8_SALFA|nr:calpain-1 catalytic subunit-like [Salarias fasciatus]